MLIDMIKDISYQHNWLADNIHQLIQDISQQAKTQQQVQKQSSYDCQQMQYLAEQNLTLRQDLQTSESQIRNKDEQLQLMHMKC